MHDDKRLNVVICWHMHQPQYEDPLTGIYLRPWTYLRAIKDYTDMAAHLEQVPCARAVVNFAPVLLEQLLDYAHQLDNYFSHSTPLRDPLLSALGEKLLSQEIEHREALIKTCLNGQALRTFTDHEDCKTLYGLATDLAQHPAHLYYVNSEFFSDLLVWYHLSWLGETVRRNDPRVSQLLEKGKGFTHLDRTLLLNVIGEQIGAIIPRYRALADTGQVELAMTPYAHPIAPLLMDLYSARESKPGLDLPAAAEYPGGEERLRWHIDNGRKIFESCFGRLPKGCWPAEGAVSDAVLRVLNDSGFLWTASGSGVLYNSLGDEAAYKRETALYHSYQIGQRQISCFFRDDQLSDLIGFTYSNWHGDDAVANLIHHLEGIAARCAQESNPLVAIIMDGENAWEHYPDNGYHFLQGLYRRLSNHPRLNLTTFSHCLSGEKRILQQVTAGSWIYGDLTTWIGCPEKNRAWEMLIAVKKVFDQIIEENRLSEEQLDAAARQLAICEGSDWFWWPGDYNPDETVSAFDSLFRTQLGALYGMLDEPQPAYLASPFTGPQRRESPSGSVMRKAL